MDDRDRALVVYGALTDSMAANVDIDLIEDAIRAARTEGRAAGFAEAIETIARHFEKHYRDYVWCRVAIEGIRTLAPAATKPK